MSAPLTGRQAVLLVARREFVTQVRSRSFVIGIVFTLVIFAAVAGVAVFVSSQTDEKTLGLTPSTVGLQPVLEQVAAQQDVTLRIVEVDDDAGRAQVEGDQLDALLSGGAGGYALLYRDAVDSTLTPVVATAAQQDALTSALSSAGVDPSSVDAQARVEPSTIEPVDPQQGQQLAVALGGTFLLFMGLQYAAGVASGVVEEKQSRVVEVVLSTVRARDLLMGKVLGIGILGLVQLLVFVVAAMAAATLTRRFTLPETTPGAILMLTIWFVLGYALYSTALGFLGALASRLEEASNASTPVTMIAMVSYFVAIFAVINDPSGIVARIATFIPASAPFVVPLRAAFDAISPVEIVISIVITVAAIWVLFTIGARVYAGAVLQTGGRMKIRDAWRSAVG